MKRIIAIVALATATHSFAEADGGTQVHVVGEAKLGGALRFAAGMAKKQAERQFRSDFARLKELLEKRDPTKAGA